MGGKLTGVSGMLHGQTASHVLTVFHHDPALLILDQGYPGIKASNSLGTGETSVRR